MSSRHRNDRRDRRDSRGRRGRRGRRIGLIDFWQNLMDDTYDFVDDSLDRVRDDDWDDLEDDVEELREAVAAIGAKLDQLLAAGAQSRSSVKTPA
ncbi:MAG: hypothetical protein ACRD0C_05510 [Acidimicrobiia bacterium]